MKMSKEHMMRFYPPRGKRGIGFSKANDYGIRFEEYLKFKSENLIICSNREYRCVKIL